MHLFINKIQRDPDGLVKLKNQSDANILKRINEKCHDMKTGKRRENFTFIRSQKEEKK